MGNSRAQAAGRSALRDAAGPTRAAAPSPGSGQSLLRVRQSLSGGTDRKPKKYRRLRTFLKVSAIILAGLCAGLIGGMLSGIA